MQSSRFAHCLMAIVLFSAAVSGPSTGWSKEPLPTSVGPVEIANCSADKAAVLGLHLSHLPGKPKALSKGSLETNRSIVVRRDRGAYPRWSGHIRYTPTPDGAGTQVTAHLGRFLGPGKKAKRAHHQEALDSLSSFLSTLSRQCSKPVDPGQPGLREKFAALSEDLRIRVWTDGGGRKLHARLSDGRVCRQTMVPNACQLPDNPSKRRVLGGEYRLEPLDDGRVTLWVKSSRYDPDFVKRECHLVCKGAPSTRSRSAGQCARFSNSVRCQTMRVQVKALINVCVQDFRLGRFPSLDACLAARGMSQKYSRLNSQLCGECGGLGVER